MGLLGLVPSPVLTVRGGTVVFTARYLRGHADSPRSASPSPWPPRSRPRDRRIARRRTARLNGAQWGEGMVAELGCSMAAASGSGGPWPLGQHLLAERSPRPRASILGGDRLDVAPPVARARRPCLSLQLEVLVCGQMRMRRVRRRSTCSDLTCVGGVDSCSSLG